MRYWGDGNTDRWPWSTQADAAEWTIDILLYGEGVEDGKGGYFKIHSGVTTIDELAAVREKVFGAKVDVVREGDLEDLEAELARLRREKGRARYGEYMSEAAAVVASKGLWDSKDVTVLKEFKRPTSLEEHFKEEKDNA